jgi:carbamoyl-phosphate synthase large subunit
MAIVYDEETLDQYMRTAVDFSHDRPVLIDKFLEQAAEFDVDALADESACVVAGIQEHIEEAGIHSGDSSCVLPPVRIAEEHLETMRHYTRKLASALSVKGLMNIQFAIKDDRVYVLEVNPRASRTVPFVSKATGVPLARIGALVMAGRPLQDFGLPETLSVDERFYIKSPGLPFPKISRRRSGAESGDALDRRSHGHRRELRRGLRESHDGRRNRIAKHRYSLYQCQRNRQRSGSCTCKKIITPRF